MAEFSDHATLITALGGAAEVADHPAVNTLPVNARAWAARNRIPPEYWPGVIQLAADKQIDVSADWLMRTTPARRRADPAASVQAAA